MDLPLEIWGIILDYLDFLSKIRLIQISKFHKNNLYISDFYKINPKYLKILNNNILNSNPRIKYLNLTDNKYIQDLNILTGLKKLYLPSSQKNQLNNYNLEEIYGLINLNIINFNNFTNLKILQIYLEGPTALPDLNNLPKLKILDISGNNLNLSSYKYLTELSISGDIYGINHLTSLKILNIRTNENITNSDISNLDLSELHIYNCPNITKINHLTNLTILEYSNNNINLDLSGLNLNKLRLYNYDLYIRMNLIQANLPQEYNGFSHMTNLTDLTFNYYKINLNNFKKLKKLNCSYSMVSDSDISEINPTELDITMTNITDISHITNLKSLTCQNNKFLTKINNPNLQILSAGHIYNIINLNLPKLKKLYFSINPKLNNIYAENLTKLSLEANPELTNLDNLINLEKLNIIGKSPITSLNNLKLSSLYLGSKINIPNLNNLPP